MLNFQIGEKVVYPNQGVGVVQNISTRSFGARAEHFYLLRLSSSSMTVMVPFSHVDDIGIRKITRNGEISKVLGFLSTGRCRRCEDWKNRFKENSDKMRAGGLLAMAEVLKSLLLLQQMRKPLSFREKKMLDRARQMLVSEISISREISVLDTTEMLEKALGKSALKMPAPL